MIRKYHKVCGTFACVIGDGGAVGHSLLTCSHRGTLSAASVTLNSGCRGNIKVGRDGRDTNREGYHGNTDARRRRRKLEYFSF